MPDPAAAGSAAADPATADPADRPPVALVTGAGRGIGRALALTLADAGYRVGVLGRTPEPVRDVAEQITATGGRALALTADVTDLAQVRAAVSALDDQWQGIDVLINNAGVIERTEQPIWEADPDEWWQIVETDLRGPFHCIRAVVPGMLERGGGRVINLNSGAGARDRATYSAYCAAKAGLFRLTGNLHLAGHRHGLRAFEVSPGVVRTDMTSSMASHRTRTEWTTMEQVSELVLAAVAGRLDPWSGCFLRAGVDVLESLSLVAERFGGQVPEPVRRLAVIPWGDDDPIQHA